MPKAAYQRELPLEGEVREAQARLHAFLEPPWHLSPEEQIPRAAYLDASPEGKARLERAKHNKLRKNWFTAVLLHVDSATAYLPRPPADTIAKQAAELGARIRRLEKTTPELVEEAEALVRRTIAALEELVSRPKPKLKQEQPPAPSL